MDEEAEEEAEDYVKGAREPSDLIPHEAGEEFAELLLDLKAKGKLSAKDVCSLCWYASGARVNGPANDMWLHPDSKTGHFQRKLDTVCGFGSHVENGYTLPVPGVGKTDSSDDDQRMTLSLPCLPIHECLQEELDTSPEVLQQCKDRLNGKEWSSHYWEHPVVRSAEPDELVVPVAIYSDGVPFANRDGVHAFYAYNLLTGVRHLIMVLRKSDMCTCPCNKWCSVFPVWDWIRWSIVALSEGKWPSRRHDGSAFVSKEDEWRKSKVGGKLMKAAVVAIKADWLEFVASMGLTRWDHPSCPCFRCVATKDDLVKLGSFSSVSSPFRVKSGFDYEAACEAAERWITIPDRATHRRILDKLEYDFRSGGSHGRSLIEDMHDLGLKKHDRVEPCSSLRNIAEFEKLRTPCRILFWRPKARSVATRRCPMFCPEAGVSVETCMVDAMHTLHLGVYKDTSRSAVWCLILGDAYDTRTGDQGSLVKLGHRALSKRLQAWYKAKKTRLRPGEHVYEIGQLTLAMIGKPTSQCLAIKAAESGTFIEFCRDELLLHVGTVSASHREQAIALLAVLEALVALRDEMRWSPRVLSGAQLQRMTDFASRAFSLREAAGIPFVPKWHLMLHLVHDAHTRGNPKHWTTFLDEDFNGKLKAMASSLHRATWYRRLLQHFRATYSKVRTRTSAAASSSKRPRR